MSALSLTKSFGLTKSFKPCISNTLSNGYVAHYNTKVNETLFNRKREIVKFTNAFNSKPKIHVVLGPPSSGKTSLVREIVNKGNFNPLFINCHSGQFDSPARIYDSFYSQFYPFLDKNKDLLRGKFSLGYAGLNITNQFNEKHEAITSVTRLLNSITNLLPNWTVWDSYNIPPPILIIDEANMFDQIVEEDKYLFKSILNWMVLNTKEENRFHVVLTSSDSFFLNWIEDTLHGPHVFPYVVGDLSAKEAEEYFEDHVLPQYGCKNELGGKFDYIRKLTGTRMVIIDNYVSEYKNSQGKLKDHEFSIFRREDRKLLYGLNPVQTSYKPRRPLWNKDDFIKVMKAIVEAENQGFVLERDLNREIGHEKIISLIDYDFLHRRPTNSFANDIVEPPNEVILTATNQPSLRAMERLLKFFK